MKCGTSSMNMILSNREDVFMAKKEIHFFTMGDVIQSPEIVKMDPRRIHFDIDFKKKIEWYGEFFRDARSGQIVGEDSTTYLSSKVAPRRIQALIPDVKLIFMLRNPVDRTYSHYWHLVKTGRATKTFEQELVHGPATLHLRSFYKPQLMRYFECFKRNQIKVVLFERFVEETQSVVDEVCSFLGLSGSVDVKDVQSHANASRYPRCYRLHLALNYFMQSRVDRYQSHWPGQSSEAHACNIGRVTSLFERLLAKLRTGFSMASYPPVDDALRERLSALYARANSGIEELIEVDINKYWNFE